MTVERTRLPNGMTLLAEELPAAPVVALQAWVHAGSADERDEESGVAHLHEHMLFKGTARRISSTTTSISRASSIGSNAEQRKASARMSSPVRSSADDSTRW